jgi:fatty acid desaturase
MSEKPKTRREKSVEWQNRYLTPILVVLALIVLIGLVASSAVGSISWWVSVGLLAFGAFTLVSVIRRNRR